MLAVCREKSKTGSRKEALKGETVVRELVRMHLPGRT